MIFLRTTSKHENVLLSCAAMTYMHVRASTILHRPQRRVFIFCFFFARRLIAFWVSFFFRRTHQREYHMWRDHNCWSNIDGRRCHSRGQIQWRHSVSVSLSATHGMRHGRVVLRRFLQAVWRQHPGWISYVVIIYIRAAVWVSVWRYVSGTYLNCQKKILLYIRK